MPSFKTKNFGVISYQAEAVVEFPSGLPAFESRRLFLALRFDDSAPLIFLQSLEDPDLCFLTLPVLAVDATYRLQISKEDCDRVGLAPEPPPRIGTDVLCLVVLSLRESGPTANLLAPVVVNLHNQKAVQAVAEGSGYSHQQVLVPQEAPVCS